MANTSGFIKVTLAVFAFGLAFYWTFVSGPSPKTTVEATMLWMASPITSGLIAIPLLIIQTVNSHAAEPKSYRVSAERDRHRRHAIDLGSSTAAAAAMILIIGQIWWAIIQGLVSSLKPYNPESEENEAGRVLWGISILTGIFALAIGGGCIWLACLPAIICFSRYKKSYHRSSLDRLEMENLHLASDEGVTGKQGSHE